MAGTLGPKLLFVGDPGTGKTFSIVQAKRHVKKLFIMFLEPGQATLRSPDMPEDLRKEIGKNIHYMYVPASNPTGLSQLLKSAKLVNTLSFEALSAMPDVEKGKANELIQILSAMSNFTCDVSGQQFGPVDQFPNDYAFALDSLSGLNIACMRCTIGNKVTAAQNQWGTAMKLQDDLLTQLTMGCDCWFMLTAHLEREVDEVTGASKIYPAALGRKNGPKVGRFFDEVIETRQVGQEYFWRTEGDSVTNLKRRVLPLSKKLPVDFSKIAESFKKELEANQSIANQGKQQ